MDPIISFSELKIKVRDSFQGGQTHRIFGVIFAPPYSLFVKENIFPVLNLYHLRTGTIIDFFFAGYWKFLKGSKYLDFQELPPSVWADVEIRRNWKFSDTAFNEIEQEMSVLLESRWAFSGTADLLIYEAVRVRGGVKLDPDPIAIDVIRLLGDKLYPDINHIFEELIHFANDHSQSKRPLTDLVNIKRSAAVAKGLVEGGMEVWKPLKTYKDVAWKEGKYFNKL